VKRPRAPRPGSARAGSGRPFRRRGGEPIGKKSRRCDVKPIGRSGIAGKGTKETVPETSTGLRLCTISRNCTGCELGAFDTAPPCAWEIPGETMWQPVPDFPLAFDPSGRGLRCPALSWIIPTVCRRHCSPDSTALLRSRTRRSAPRLTNLGSPSRCGRLDPCWSGRPANRAARRTTGGPTRNWL
jgi:hypothetical protein